MNPYVAMYVPMVDFLADFLGAHAEVVLHDVTDLEHSIIKIRNGHISGRTIGDPATDWLMRRLYRNQDSADYQCNYRGVARDGATLKSASFFIRDGGRAVVGVLCVNMQIDQYLKAREFLDSMLADVGENGASARENLGQSVDEIIDGSVQAALAPYGCDAGRLRHSEKMKIIERISNDGVFMLKGAVGKAAARLNMSEPTVYRYLSKLGKSRNARPSEGKKRGAHR